MTMLNAAITVVRSTRNRPEAVVFPGKGGFFFLDIRSDAEPVGPYKSRERAEEIADISVEIDRHFAEVMTPKPGARRNVR